MLETFPSCQHLTSRLEIHLNPILPSGGIKSHFCTKTSRCYFYRRNERHSTESLTERQHFDRHLRQSDNTSMVDSHHRIRTVAIKLPDHTKQLSTSTVRQRRVISPSPNFHRLSLAALETNTIRVDAHTSTKIPQTSWLTSLKKRPHHHFHRIS